MKHKFTRQLLAFALALALAVSCLPVPAMAAPAEAEDPAARAQADRAEGKTYAIGSDGKPVDPDTQVEIMVRLEQEPVYMSGSDLQTAAVQAPSLLAGQARAENRIERTLDTSIEVNENFTLLFNGFSFTGEYWMLDAINAMDGMTAFIPETYELVSSVDGELTPSMGTSTGMISATTAWELGYTGEGTVIAIIDTGLRTSHEAFSVAPASGRMDEAYLQQVYAQYGDLLHAGSDLDSIYHSAKLPFCWDYFDGDADPNHTSSDHGTHVAGIAAGNNGGSFKGVAPEAQLVIMQVFTAEGGAYFSTILAALEDCVYLGVDSINMSLGSVAGWADYASLGFEEMEGVYEALQDGGISVVVAAGNNDSTLHTTNFGSGKGLSANPDVGTVNSPSTLPGSFSVASVVPAVTSGYAVVGGKEFFYGSVEGNAALDTIPGEYELVYVGLATAEEIEAAGGLEGKIALTQRGTITFTQKCDNCAAAGAAGVLMFNNVTGVFNPSVTSPVPYGKLTYEQGLEMVAQLADGVHGTITIKNEFNGKSISMAQTSSWGTTSDLRITPDISAPGDSIRSAVGSGNNAYGNKYGTSMAAPHVAAAMGLIKQRARELFPDATERQIHDLGYALAMSTAHQVTGFVRQQGAGVIDVAAALTTEVYLSVEDSARPKLELDDSTEGVFQFTFTVNNAGESQHTYAIDFNAMTEKVIDSEYTGDGWQIRQEPATVKLITGTILDVTDLCIVDAPETVTVAPGESVDVDVTVTCSEELMAWFRENCPSGMFLEGFVTLDEIDSGNAVDLSIPFLGFVGDWDYPSILDRNYYWQTATGELSFQQLSSSLDNQAGFGHQQALGLNPYADMTGKTYLADRNAISPNGDGVLDLVNYLEFTLLRNPSTVKVLVEDLEGNVLQTLYDESYTFHRDYYTGDFNGGNSFSYLNLAFDMADFAENETVNLVLETWLDHEGYDPAANESGRWVIPVTKDTVAPTVRVVEGGIEIQDDNYVAAYRVYADEARTQLLYEESVFAGQRDQVSFYETDQQVLYVSAADYAGNEQLYMVADGLVAALDAEAFYHGRTIIGQQSKNYLTGTYDFEWVSFRSDLPEAITYLTNVPGSNMPECYYEDNVDLEYISATVNADGQLYANTLSSIFVLDPYTHEGTEVLDVGENYYLRNIAFRPGTNELYGWVDTAGWGWPVGWFVKFDLESGSVNQIFEFTDTDTSSIWAMTFLDADHVAVHDSYASNITVFDLEGNITEFYAGQVRNDMGGSHLGNFGYGGCMVYDETTESLYLASDWTWFISKHFSWCGIIKFDLDRENGTMDTTLMVSGEPAGLVITGLYFEDQIVYPEPVELEDFELSETSLDLLAGESAEIDVTWIPGDANQFDLDMEILDSAVAGVRGNRSRLIVSASSAGQTQLLVTATSKTTGLVVAQKTVDITVSYDEALCAAVNAKGGQLAFVSTAPYPFVAAEDEATGRTVAVSTNTGADYGESWLIMDEALYLGDTVTFDYYVSSEEDYDCMYFYANGLSMLQASGDTGWSSGSYTASLDGTTLEWAYVKDISGNSGEDLTMLDNITLIPGAVRQVVMLIEAIGDSELDADAILAAREAYDALTGREKACVDNYQTLLDAEAAYAELLEVIALIDAIGEVTLDSKEAIDAARAAYEALDPIRKEGVTNYETLVTAEYTYMLLKAQHYATEAARYFALYTLELYDVDTTGWTGHQLEDLAAALAQAEADLKAAATLEEVEAVLPALEQEVARIAASCPASGFEDVDLDRYYHEAVDLMVLEGLMTGTDKTHFAPDATMTRAQLITVLYRAAGQPDVAGLETSFTDLRAGAYYYDAVVWAENAGVAEGVSANTFAPDAPLTRQQLVVLLYRFSGESTDGAVPETFTDRADVAPYAQEAMAWAVEQGIVTGTSADTLSPAAEATRAQAATMLMRWLTR